MPLHADGLFMITRIDPAPRHRNITSKKMVEVGQIGKGLTAANCGIRDIAKQATA